MGQFDENVDRPASYIRAVFDSIASRYDLMNRLLTFGMYGGWQRRLMRSAAPLAGETVLDIGCGTGDLVIAAARRVGPTGRVHGLDASEAMLSRAADRVSTARVHPWVTLHRGDVSDLPFPDGGFDLVTAGFVLRNVGGAGLRRVLGEVYRVLKKGGRLAVLEVFRPDELRPAVRLPFRLYFNGLVPLLGSAAAACLGVGRVRADQCSGKPANAYGWLVASVDEFVAPSEFTVLLRESGFGGIRRYDLAFGVVGLHLAEK